MRQNNEEFTNLHNRLYSKLFSFVRLRIKDPEEVKDIVQDTFLKAYNSWDQVPDENTARNFLYIIARQRMIDIWRSAKSRLQTDLLNKNYDENSLAETGDFDSLESDEPLPSEIFQESENKELALTLLNGVRQEEREILTLRFLQELEYSELAKIYKTSEDNMRQKVSRALQNIRRVAQKSEAIKSRNN